MEAQKRMKALLAAGMLAAALPAMAQDCGQLRLDLRTGTLNGVRPTASQDEVKAALPCHTGETEEGSGYNYGGGVFYLNHSFYFYTHRDYLEVREGFPGTVSQPLMGASEERVLALIGKPDRKMGDGMGRKAWLYKTRYGSLRLSFGASSDESWPGAEVAVEEIGIHSQKPKEVKLGD